MPDVDVKDIRDPATIYVEAPAEPATPTNDSAESGVEDLRKQLAEHKQAREDAERQVRAEREARLRDANARHAAESRATTATADAVAARVSEADAQYNSIVNALTAYQKQRDAMQDQYAKLLEEAKYGEAAKLNTEIATVASRITQLEDGKVAAEDAKKASATAAAARPADAAAQPAADQTTQEEQFLSTQQPYNAAWIRQHRAKFFGDEEFRDAAIAASNYATKVLKLRGGTDEYFRHIEEATGVRQRQEQQQPAEPQRQTQQHQPAGATPHQPASSAAASTSRSSPVPAAAPSRSVPGAGPGQPGGVPITLSAEERQIARLTLTPDIIGKNQDGTPRDPERVFAEHKAARLRAEAR